MAPRTKRPDGATVAERERRPVYTRGRDGVWREAGYIERAPEGGWRRVHEDGDLDPKGPPAPLASGVSVLGVRVAGDGAGSWVGDLLLGFVIGELLAELLRSRRRG